MTCDDLLLPLVLLILASAVAVWGAAWGLGKPGRRS
jgi:hypothetical protein